MAISRDPRFPTLSIPNSNMILWLKATQGVFSDSTLGTAATIDVDSVGSWKDLSPQGNHCVMATAANQPTYVTIGGTDITSTVGGRPCVLFKPTNDGQSFLNFGSNMKIDYQNFSFFAVTVIENVSDAFNAYMEGGSASVGCLYNYSGQQMGALYCYANGNPSKLTTPFTVSPCQEAVMGFTASASNVKMHNNNTVNTGTAQVAGSALGGNLGRYSAGGAGAYFHGLYREIICFNQALSDADAQLVKNYFYAKYAISSVRDKRVITDGDSITAGAVSSYLNNYPSCMMRTMTQFAGYELINTGVNSVTLQTFLANAPTNIDPLYDGTKTKNICVIFAGTNDFTAGRTVAQVYADLQSYCAGRRAVGFKVIIVTMLPRGSYETERIAYNSNMTTNWASFADGIANTASDANMGQVNQNYNTTYYVDTIHPTNLGYSIVATYVKTAVLSV